MSLADTPVIGDLIEQISALIARCIRTLPTDEQRTVLAPLLDATHQDIDPE